MDGAGYTRPHMHQLNIHLSVKHEVNAPHNPAKMAPTIHLIIIFVMKFFSKTKWSGGSSYFSLASLLLFFCAPFDAVCVF